MIINNVELEDLDLLDADIADKYETALKVIKKGSVKNEGLSLGDAIRKECNLVFDFFNAVFGEGTDKKVFGNKNNYRDCLMAFDQVIKSVGESQKEIDKIMGKYSSNRAQRRAGK